jgi:SAM-dependent methyltransferase
MQESFYEEYARVEEGHWWFVGRRRIFDAVLQGLALSEQARLLDVGCGTGANLRFLSAYGRALGVDRSAAAARFASGRAPAPVLRAEVASLPVASESIDLVTALDLLEHVEDEAACMDEMERVCRPGGFVLVTVPAHPWMWGRQDVLSLHRRRYRVPELRALLTRRSLEIVHLTYINALLFPVVAAVRLFRRAFGTRSGAVASDFAMTEPGPMNTLLGRIFGAESWWIARSSLPLGVSLLCLARKPPSRRAERPHCR